MSTTVRTLALVLVSACFGLTACSTDDAPDRHEQRSRLGGKADLPGTCEGSCGDQSADGCWCDDLCSGYGDCCSDFEAVCLSEPEPPQPQGCGGLAGLSCSGEHQYCDYPDTAACGYADAMGVCKDRPEVCPEIYAPVCGCDGTTYDNECFANAAGTSPLHAGECDGEQPDPTPEPEPEPTTTCSGACGGASADGCWCDDLCSDYGDCCDDFADTCEGRTPISGVCTLSSGDECETDADCMVGGCGGELCFNPEISDGITTCICPPPSNSGCGCVNGSCSWWQ